MTLKQNKPSKWEDEFDNIWEHCASTTDASQLDLIKDYIKQLLSDQKRELSEYYSDKLCKKWNKEFDVLYADMMKPDFINKYKQELIKKITWLKKENNALEGTIEASEIIGYNQARIDIIKIINSI